MNAPWAMRNPDFGDLLRCRGIAVGDYSFTPGRVSQCNEDPVIGGVWGILDFRSIKVPELFQHAIRSCFLLPVNTKNEI
jgi:hypothetical protein